MSIDIGVMLRGQYPFGVDMAHMVEDLLEQARLADSLGYDSITKGSTIQRQIIKPCSKSPCSRD